MWAIYHPEGVTLVYLRGETVPYSGYLQEPTATFIARLRPWTSDSAKLAGLRQILTEARVAPAGQIGQDAAAVTRQFETALNSIYLTAASKARSRIVPAAVQRAPRQMAPWDADAPSDARVNEIIEDALRRTTNTDGIVHIDNAWGVVQSWRESSRVIGWADEATANVNYAAADHYFQNRFFSIGGLAMPGAVMAISMTLAIPVYDFVKSTFGAARTGSGAPSAPSAFVRAWGHRGTFDGLATRAVSGVMRMIE